MAGCHAVLGRGKLSTGTAPADRRLRLAKAGQSLPENTGRLVVAGLEVVGHLRHGRVAASGLRGGEVVSWRETKVYSEEGHGW